MQRACTRRYFHLRSLGRSFQPEASPALYGVWRRTISHVSSGGPPAFPKDEIAPFALDQCTADQWKTLTSIMAPLSGRSVISVRGLESGRLLQGLVTNDIRTLSDRSCSIGEHERSPFSNAMYTAFLTTSGRVLSEGHIVQCTYGDQEGFFVECDRQVAEALYKHIRRYRLRAKVSVKLETDMQVLSLLSCTGQSDEGALMMPKFSKLVDCGSLLFRDSRHPVMGVRMILSGTDARDLIPREFAPVEEEFYHLYRMTRNVPEGAEEVLSQEALPLESNFDELGAISYDKGCYIGQELTSRVHYTGVVRKRLVPVLSGATDELAMCLAANVRSELDANARSGSEQLLPSALLDSLAVTTDTLPLRTGDALLPCTTGDGRRTRKRGAGRVTSSLGRVGIALLRLDCASGALMSGDDGPYVGAIWPPVFFPVK